MAVNDYKVTVIGGGIGGYVSAIRAAQLGAKVALIERAEVGGTCLNVGCIPTKVLLHTAELYEELKNADELGLELENKPKVNWQKLQTRRVNIIDKLVKGVEMLLKSNNITLIRGEASFVDNKSVKVRLSDGKEDVINSEYFVIATGSEPMIPPIKGSDLEGVIDSTKALCSDKLPEEVVIIGGGVIGIEFASVYSAFGTRVNMIEMMPKIGQSMDSDVAAMLSANMEKSGIEIHTSAKVVGIEKKDGRLCVKYELNGEDKFAYGDNVLISTGRKSVITGLETENAKVAVSNRGFVTIDSNMRTNVNNIYAVGDVTGKVMLAHVAEEQGIVAVENMLLGDNKTINYDIVPGCLYTKPEVAYVGITEDEAKNRGIDYETGMFPLINNGKTLITGDVENTFIKVVTDKKYDEIIGISIYGPRATEMISEFSLGINLEVTVDELIETIHPHPTVSEGLKEAVLAVKKQAIHSMKAK
ncbi:dihydrolipoyl dehydrogenase [Sedimentibacter sp.]|uniref:dihydrolipoyl dehydrogenase n=1 Tax=Sedimentibacter sp. TaxID=1960295 RepID=UPI0028A80E82|nr:dihydrolipoyl dehydrogenase [Sedimentibacter sp.]